MMALTGIGLAMAFVMVQFSAITYSPQLVLWFTRDRILFHALGAFAATFVYALFTLAWVDRNGSAKVPLSATLLVGDHHHHQHAHVRAVDAAPRGPSNRQCIASGKGARDERSSMTCSVA